MSLILNRTFRYANAARTSQPGYLKRKFDRIRKELREKAEREKVCRECGKGAQ